LCAIVEGHLEVAVGDPTLEWFERGNATGPARYPLGYRKIIHEVDSTRLRNRRTLGVVLLKLWKPFGVLTKFTDTEGRPTLADYCDVPGVYPVGRLDQDSEGLLLLTDDGALAHRLTAPKFDHPKTYWAQVERIPDAAALRVLQRGVVLKDGLTKPAIARLLEDTEPELPPRDPPIRHRLSVPTAWIELTITEGRNRQVRRMTAAVGHPTLRLVRARIGNVGLDGLASGEWREMTSVEERQLRGRSGKN
jgi:pseudouridine synthase